MENASNHKPQQYSGRKGVLPKTLRYFGILLDEKLNFRQHIDTTILKVAKQRYFCNEKT